MDTAPGRRSAPGPSALTSDPPAGIPMSRRMPGGAFPRGDRQGAPTEDRAPHRRRAVRLTRRRRRGTAALAPGPREQMVGAKAPTVRANGIAPWPGWWWRTSWVHRCVTGRPGLSGRRITHNQAGRNEPGTESHAPCRARVAPGTRVRREALHQHAYGRPPLPRAAQIHYDLHTKLPRWGDSAMFPHRG